MFLITEDKPSNRKIGFMRVVAFAVLSIIVLGSAFLAYVKSRGINLESVGLKQTLNMLFTINADAGVSGKAETIAFDIKNDKWLGTCREYIVIYRNDKIIGLDGSGGKKWEYPMEMYNPCADYAGSFIAVADFGGKTVCLIKDKRLVWEDKLDKEIVNVTVNSDGYVAVATTETEGHKARVVVYDPAGVEIFSRKIADRYVVSSEVSPDNDEVVINTLDANGPVAETGIEFTTILGKHIAGVKPGTDCIFPYMAFLGEDWLVAAGATAIVCYDENRNISWSMKYPVVYSISVINKQLAAVVMDKAPGTKAEVVVRGYSPNGDTIWTFKPGDRVINIRSYDEILGVNTGREVLFLNNGKVFDSFASMSDIIDISFLNKTKAVLVTRENIKIYHLQAGE
jgi:hypothetical protein